MHSIALIAILLLEHSANHAYQQRTCVRPMMQQPVKTAALALHKLWGKSEDQIVKVLGKADEPPGGPAHSLAYFKIAGKGTLTFLNDSKYYLRFDFDRKPGSWRAALTSTGIPLAGISATSESPKAQGDITDGLKLRGGVFARLKGLAEVSYGNVPLLDGSGRKWALLLEARDDFYAPQSRP